jgi:hypothetical protein
VVIKPLPQLRVATEEALIIDQLGVAVEFIRGLPVAVEKGIKTAQIALIYPLGRTALCLVPIPIPLLGTDGRPTEEYYKAGQREDGREEDSHVRLHKHLLSLLE